MPYRWNSERRVYTTDKGKQVSAAQIREWIDASVEHTKERVTAITQELIDGKINSSEWYLRTRDELKPMHMAMTQLAAGGRQQVGPRELGRLGARMRGEIGYLRDLANQIENGDVEADEALINRATLYADSGVGTFENARRGGMKDSGFKQEKNILERGAQHCDDCLAETRRGWVKVGELSAIGDRQCLARDRCMMVYR